MIEVPVLVAGGGPIGLVATLELARYGIASLVVEKNESTTQHPKMDLTSGRSMELLRRIGMADKFREVGVPPRSPFNISWITDLSADGHELHRFPYLSSEDEYWRRRTHNDGTLTLEAPLRVSQIMIEPVLKQAAEADPNVEVRFGWRLLSFTQDDDGVTSIIKSEKSGEEVAVRSRYLLGCDGGGSTVRHQLDIACDGQPNAARLYMIHFRSTAHDVLQRFGIAWHYQTGKGILVAQDDHQFWTLHIFLPPGTDEAALDPAAMVREWVGCDFDFEIMVSNPWSAHYLVAQQYGSGRVFLAGDACHQFMPTGGYGMNTGIAEIANLGWKVAATLKGWAGPELLASYHDERHPIAHLSWGTSRKHLDIRFKLQELYAEAGDLSGDEAQDAAKRLRTGRAIADLTNAENECWGTEHGYRYEVSAVIVPEDSEAPGFDPLIYTPSTYPGSRLPSMFLKDGTALFDHLGPWFTLINLGIADMGSALAASQESGIPLQVLQLDEPDVRRVYGCDLIIVRPDHHVAWRGDSLPDDITALLNQVAGHGSPSPTLNGAGRREHAIA